MPQHFLTILQNQSAQPPMKVMAQPLPVMTMFMTSVLSPPGYMKVSGINEGLIEAAPNYNTTDCRLLDGYADFVVRYLRVARDSIGVETRAWSIQNEPAFQEPYASCVYNGTRYVSVLKATAAAVAGAGLTTGFFGGEHMSWSFPNPFESAVRGDAAALAAMHAWAVHGYTDGVHADTGSFGGSTVTDKPLWMSETSGASFGSSITDWAGAMTLARQIHGYLRAGRMSLWNFLHIMVSGNAADAAGSALYSDGQMTAKAYASAHFYHYIRPGARQVASTSSDGNVAVVAFWHETNQCLSLILMNNSGGAIDVTAINGTGLPSQFEMVTSTDAAKNTRSTVSRTSTISLPAQSITTLVNGAYRSTLPVQVAPDRHANAAATPRVVAGTGKPVRTYACDGRRIQAGVVDKASGVYLTRKADGRAALGLAVGR